MTRVRLCVRRAHEIAARRCAPGDRVAHRTGLAQRLRLRHSGEDEDRHDGIVFPIVFSEPADLEAKSRADLIFDIVRERICLGQYPPGHVLYEGALGQEFSVSRTPIRQVLQRLELEHMAVVRTGVGTVVTIADAAAARTSLRIRSRIFDMVAELGLARAGTETDDRVATLLGRCDRLEEHADVDALWRVMRDYQALSNAMIGDDLIAQLDQQLFFRIAPIIVSRAAQEPAEAAAAMRDTVRQACAVAKGGDATVFFKVRSANEARYATLLV